MLGDRGQSGGIGPWTGFVALSVAVAALFLCPVAVSAQEEAEAVEQDTLLPLAAPAGLSAIDTPNDRGSSINVTWELSSDDEGDGIVAGYEVFRSAHPETGFAFVGRVPFGVTEYRDSGMDNGAPTYYRVATLDVDESPFFSGTFGPVDASIQWFNRSRLNALVAVIIFVLSILYFVNAAKSGKKLFIRRLAGLDEMDNAVGRATEMGKPILFISGLSSVSDVATIAAINILGEVAKKTAEYNTKLIVPCADPIVMAVEQEVVKEAYAKAGRPDAYNEDDVFYLTRSQFAYVAGVNGIMVRQRPATILYMGMFYAESLVLAETGSSIGAIQIAGTDAVTQLPFFITSCDYTLIGEELYAASAYLSREPILLGGLKGQDMFKLITVVFLLVGIVAATLTATGAIENNFMLAVFATAG
ncbi:fibronectin type III domain-containing protein [bacterium]|nr:fibronectin type III domain-containing protein [bacterium]